MISSSPRLLSDNTQHSQQTNIQAAGGIRIHDLTGQRPLESALDGNITIAINVTSKREGFHYNFPLFYVPAIEITGYFFLLSFPLHLPSRVFFCYWRYNPLWVCILQPSSGAIASSPARFLDHTQRRATVGRTPLNE